MLICTDFSEAANHAAKYGCMLANQYRFGFITLFHTYQMIVPSTTLPLDGTYTYTGDEPAKASLKQLKNLKEELSKLAGEDTTIRIRSENLTLGESINTICQEEYADMVVMGASGKSKLERVLIGSTTINVAQNSKYPVLVVPEQAPLEPIRSILFACDLSEINATTPFDRLDRVLELFQVPLFVVNVDDKNRHFSPQTPEEIYQLHHIFDKYKPRYAFIDNEDIAEGITRYVEKNNISLVITVPKNYNFIQQLFHRSTTKKLIYQSSVPVLSLHE